MMKPLPDARLERVLASLALIVISLISLTNVVTRYVTGGSLAFTEEFSVFLMVVVTFAGASVALRRNGHIRIGLLERALPGAPRKALIVFQWLCGALVLGLITWFGGKLAWQEYQWESLSPGLGLPQWWYVVWLPVLSAAMLATLGTNTYNSIAKYPLIAIPLFIPGGEDPAGADHRLGADAHRRHGQRPGVGRGVPGDRPLAAAGAGLQPYNNVSLSCQWDVSASRVR